VSDFQSGGTTIAMPRGAPLTEHERGQIDAFAAQSLSHREIADRLGRSKTVVQHYLSSPETYGTAKRLGRPPSLSPSDSRRMLRAAHTGKYSSAQLKHALDLPISSRSVRRKLSECPTLKYKKRKKTPALTRAHQLKRLQWARDRTTWSRTWRKVVFSDEKKFNLDGPDGFQYYWHDLRKEEEVFSKRQMGGGSVMVWGAFSYRGKSTLAILNGRQDSVAYVRTLQEYLLPFTTRHHAAGSIFQQDNASIHVSAHTKSWLADQNIPLLDWPAKSPDLNPIENLWGILCRRVYANGRQFESREALIQVILHEWSQIDLTELRKLVLSMPKRLGEVREFKGAKTTY
jgi:transposase